MADTHAGTGEAIDARRCASRRRRDRWCARNTAHGPCDDRDSSILVVIATPPPQQSSDDYCDF
eukprot:4065750-Pleurochrysis_carterae.AAC.1